jgi:hypothetical protein
MSGDGIQRAESAGVLHKIETKHVDPGIRTKSSQPLHRYALNIPREYSERH